jgi:hypothetical protein
MSSLTLPKSGGLVNGELIERPMLALPTDVSDSSSLPTPTARDHKEQTLGWIWQRGGVTQEDTLPRALTQLLPTPNTMDHLPAREGEAYDRMLYRGGSSSKREASGNLREVVVHSLLPTPRSRLEGNQHYKGRDKGNLEDIPELFGESTPPQSDDGSLF